MSGKEISSVIIIRIKTFSNIYAVRILQIVCVTLSLPCHCHAAPMTGFGSERVVEEEREADLVAATGGHSVATCPQHKFTRES